MITQIIWRQVGDFTPADKRRLLITFQSGEKRDVWAGYYDPATKIYQACEELPETDPDFPWTATHWADWPQAPT